MASWKIINNVRYPAELPTDRDHQSLAGCPSCPITVDFAFLDQNTALFVLLQVQSIISPNTSQVLTIIKWYKKCYRSGRSTPPSSSPSLSLTGGPSALSSVASTTAGMSPVCLSSYLVNCNFSFQFFFSFLSLLSFTLCSISTALTWLTRWKSAK